MEEENAPQSAAKRVKFRVVGDVQNVGYRHWARELANQRALGGRIKNESDGSVTALFIGANPDDIKAALFQGPPQARVLEVVALALDDDDLAAAADCFEIL